MIKYLLTFFVLLSSSSFSKETKFEKRLQKDIKKLSKFSGFIDDNLKLYSEDEISDKKNTIVIIYNHGQGDGQKRLEKCHNSSNDVSEVIRSLHNKEIKGLSIKVYRMCSGVRGLNDPQMDRVTRLLEKDGNANGYIEIVDYDGMRLFDKVKQHLRRQITIDKVDELREKGFSNIVLAGQSCGGFLSIYLASHFPDKIKGSIVHNPACYGNIKERQEFPTWASLRDDWQQTISQFSEINSLAFIHDKDPFENSNTLSFLNTINKFQIINFTNFDCKKMMGTSFHSAAVYPLKDNCFTKWEAKNNYIFNYLEEIF